jgi:hypothetical protein
MDFTGAGKGEADGCAAAASEATAANSKQTVMGIPQRFVARATRLRPMGIGGFTTDSMAFGQSPDKKFLCVVSGRKTDFFC